MSKLWKYNNWDDSIGGVLNANTYKEKYVFQPTSPGSDYSDVTTDEVAKNDFISKYNYDNKDYLIYSLVSESLKKIDVKDINYKTELISGKKLNPIQSFSNEGFLTSTKYYVDYVDSLNPGTLVLVIDESYTTMPEDSSEYPSVRRPLSRTKIRKWTRSNGDIDTFNTKVTTKHYDSFSKRNKEGVRRRNEIINILSENTAMGGILSGIFLSEQDSFNKLTSIMEQYSSSISSYVKSGRSNIYSDIQNDSSNTWLDGIVVDSVQTQAMTPQMIGMTLRSYIIEKLKGNIK